MSGVAGVRIVTRKISTPDHETWIKFKLDTSSNFVDLSFVRGRHVHECKIDIST